MDEFQQVNNNQVVLEKEVADETLTAQIPAKPWYKKISRRWAIIVIIILIVAGLLYYFKGIFVAASVDGKLISRYSIIKQVESKYGKQALDYMITEKLIQIGLEKSDITISNEEINKEVESLTANFTSQGTTLATVLAQNNMTENDLRAKIVTQKKLEKILADKIVVTDEEVGKYIKDNKVAITKGQEAEQRAQISDSLKQQKFNTEADVWIEGLRMQASISYFTDYK